MGAGRLLLPCMIFCLSIIGCGPQPPQYRDPLADLSSARGVTVPENISVKAGPTVALTLGSNVERFLKYQDDGNAYAASLGFGKKLLDQGNPQHLVDGAVGILKRRYPKIKTVDDLASAASQRFSTTFVIDIQTKAGMYPGDHTTVDIVVIAFNAEQKPTSRIAARGATQIRPYESPRIREAHDQALTELSGKADQLLN
jgi:hypothetical protein